MMKAAHSRQGQNVARLVRACLNRPSRRCRLLQSDVRAVFVIVGQIITPKPPEMLLVQWDDVIEYFAARTSDPALGDSVLPGASSTGANGSNACGSSKPLRSQKIVMRESTDSSWSLHGRWANDR